MFHVGYCSKWPGLCSTRVTNSYCLAPQSSARPLRKSSSMSYYTPQVATQQGAFLFESTCNFSISLASVGVGHYIWTSMLVFQFKTPVSGRLTKGVRQMSSLHPEHEHLSAILRIMKLPRPP